MAKKKGSKETLDVKPAFLMKEEIECATKTLNLLKESIAAFECYSQDLAPVSKGGKVISPEEYLGVVIDLLYSHKLVLKRLMKKKTERLYEAIFGEESEEKEDLDPHSK